MVIAAWRHPDTPADAGRNFAHYAKLAQLAERARFDAVFLADSVGVRNTDLPSLSRTARTDHFEPLTLFSALAALTERIGLIATVSTTYNEPYHVARKFASLDHISGGRAGWNLVTSSGVDEARNFNLDQHVEHARRYERAGEFHDVVTGLWNSWDDDAFIHDKESGVFFDPEKLHVLNHKGKHFSVRGPLNVSRSPQGWPVVVHAGASEAGRDLAARTAEVIFVAHQTFAEAQAFYADIKARAVGYGRRRDDIKIMPGIFPVVAPTQEQAEAKFQHLQDLIHPTVGMQLLSNMIGGFDLSGYPVDGPVPELPETNGGKSRQNLLLDLARRDNLTIRQLYLRIAGADGFNIMSPWLPGGLEDFIELVVPELRRRGLFRTEYEGPTLRENLGLRRPADAGQPRRQVAAV